MLASADLWHHRLGHPHAAVLSSHLSEFSIPCNRNSHDPLVCESCQQGKHVRLPFTSSISRSTFPFELLHCDLWTSPHTSVSGFKYYLVILDDYTHFVWTFPLRNKSEVYTIFLNFQRYVAVHFLLPIRFIQCDNGREFDNHKNRNFFLQHGILLRFSCPYTSPQNGKAERSLRTINDIVRTLLIHSSMPPKFWAEALRTATYLLNIRPSQVNPKTTPYFSLFLCHPNYPELRVFGCLCFPNTSATSPNKLAPRSLPCVFLGYSDEHKGYRCLDLLSGRIHISRHVTFVEHIFPFASLNSSPNSDPSNSLPISQRSSLPAATAFFPLFPAATAPTAPMPDTPTPTAATPQPSQNSAAATPSPSTPPPSAATPQPSQTSVAAPSLPIHITNSTTADFSAAISSSNTISASSAASPSPSPLLPARVVTTIPPTNDHTMRTRSKSGFRQPVTRLNLHASPTLSLPSLLPTKLLS